jgi:hypothetical protein
MVADIAGIFGNKAVLTREQMIYCLFRHTAAQAVRDLVVRIGERYLVRHVSVRAFQGIARKVGVTITQQAIGKGVSRWLPIVGAVGVGAYAYYDTSQSHGDRALKRDRGWRPDRVHRIPCAAVSAATPAPFDADRRAAVPRP